MGGGIGVGESGQHLSTGAAARHNAIGEWRRRVGQDVAAGDGACVDLGGSARIVGSQVKVVRVCGGALVNASRAGHRDLHRARRIAQPVSDGDLVRAHAHRTEGYQAGVVRRQDVVNAGACLGQGAAKYGIVLYHVVIGAAVKVDRVKALRVVQEIATDDIAQGIGGIAAHVPVDAEGRHRERVSQDEVVGGHEKDRVVGRAGDLIADDPVRAAVLDLDATCPAGDRVPCDQPAITGKLKKDRVSAAEHPEGIAADYAPRWQRALAADENRLTAEVAEAVPDDLGRAVVHPLQHDAVGGGAGEILEGVAGDVHARSVVADVQREVEGAAGAEERVAIDRDIGGGARRAGLALYDHERAVVVGAAATGVQEGVPREQAADFTLADLDIALGGSVDHVIEDAVVAADIVSRVDLHGAAS